MATVTVTVGQYLNLHSSVTYLEKLTLRVKKCSTKQSKPAKKVIFNKNGPLMEMCFAIFKKHFRYPCRHVSSLQCLLRAFQGEVVWVKEALP